MNKNGEKGFYDYLDDGWAFIKDMAYATKMEIVVLSGIGGLIGGITSYNNESAKEKHIPSVFSELETTRRYLGYEGQVVPPLTQYYSVVNDVPMKVFESSNIANKLTGHTSTFARELETRINKSQKFHALISEYAVEIGPDADAALHSLDKYVKAQKDLPPLVNALDDAWDESHDDIYRTEYYTEQECDSDGKNCRTVTKSREVYDHTHHEYDYNRAAGRKSYQLLDAFIKKYPDLEITEKLIKARQTEAWNEYAIEQSLQVDASERLSPDTLLTLANTWARTNHLTRNAPHITAHHGKLLSVKKDFSRAVVTAHSDSYDTYSSSDAGPAEYQIMESTLSHSSAILNDTKEITAAIDYARHKIPALNEKIKEFIGVSLDRKPGDEEKLKEEVLTMAQDIYKSNFVNGFDIDPFSAGNVVLFTLLGLAVGAGAGFGVDKLVDNSKSRNGLKPNRF